MPNTWSKDALDEFLRQAQKTTEARQAAEAVVNGGSWSAPTFGPIYFIAMRAWSHAVLAIVLGLIPGVNLAFGFYAAVYGKRIAWKSRSWRDLDDFLVCQRAWDMWAKVVCVATILALVAATAKLVFFN